MRHQQAIQLRRARRVDASPRPPQQRQDPPSGMSEGKTKLVITMTTFDVARAELRRSEVTRPQTPRRGRRVVKTTGPSLRVTKANTLSVTGHGIGL